MKLIFCHLILPVLVFALSCLNGLPYTNIKAYLCDIKMCIVQIIQANSNDRKTVGRSNDKGGYYQYKIRRKEYLYG